jgi:hypothetical protein
MREKDDILARYCPYCGNKMHWSQSDDGCDTCLLVKKFMRERPLAFQRIREEYQREMAGKERER